MIDRSKITLKGIGKSDKDVIIDITEEIDTYLANKFMGAHADIVIKEFLSIHYPGVKINPSQIEVSIIYLKNTYNRTEEKLIRKKSILNSIMNKLRGGFIKK